MNPDSHELAEQIHRQALEQIRKDEAEGRALVEAMCREALRRQQEQNLPPPADRPKAVHYTELPEAKLGSPCASEWNTYRREVARLLSEGHEGRYALIKGGTIVGIYDTDESAREEGLRRYLLEPFLVQPIRAEEPYLRVRGVNFPWPNLLAR